MNDLISFLLFFFLKRKIKVDIEISIIKDELFTVVTADMYSPNPFFDDYFLPMKNKKNFYISLEKVKYNKYYVLYKKI